MSLQHRNIASENLNHYFLCNYIPRTKGSDKLSKSLLGFKQGLYPHKQAWIDCSDKELKHLSNLHEFLILRALSNDELIISSIEKPLDELGKKLAITLHGIYEPTLLYKRKEIPKMKQLSRAQRKDQLQDVYGFHEPSKMIAGVLLIDDILTTGYTLVSIVSSIRIVLPTAPIILFTMAFTDYHDDPNQYVTLTGNDYTWKQEIGWTTAEEDTTFYNPPIEILKALILTNSFPE